MTQLVTLSCNLASDSEDPNDSEDDAQSDSLEMGNFIEHSYEVLFVPDADVECVKYRAGKGFRYIYYICRWWLEKGGGGGECAITFGRFGGESELICLC